MSEKKQETKKEFDEKFQSLENLIKDNQDLDPRAKAVAITNLQTAKMWAVKSIFDKAD